VAMRWPGKGRRRTVASINTAAVDVMLVLLIIFLITIPVVITWCRWSYQGAEPVRQTKHGKHLDLGEIGDVRISGADRITERGLVRRLKRIVLNPQPEVISEGTEARYESIARGVRLPRAGIVKVNFIIEPPVAGG